MNQPGTGLYVGTVESNKLDQDGCIGVKIPALGATFKARVAAPLAGSDRGVVLLPEQNDQVVIACVVGADAEWAVLGSLWSRNEKPPVSNGDGKNDVKVIKTRGGNVIRLIDKDGDEGIEITDKTGKNKISIQTKTNAVSIASTDGSISLKARSIDIEATGGDVKIKGGPNVKLNHP
jgi:uncharacterized protein involved in type VI secretion and phage assembly